MAGDGEYLAAHLVGIAGGGKGAGTGGGFDNHDTMGQPGDDPIATWKVSVARLRAGRLLGDEAALSADPCL